MRTDATIDKRQVPCPNASTLGYDKRTAQVGDILTWQDGHTGRTVGRMIGRVHYAPTLGDTPAIRDYILVVGLNAMLDHTFERWVNPADVLRVESMQGDHGAELRRQVMTWFLSDQMTVADVAEVRRSTTDGWTTLEKYRAYRAKIEADKADFDVRHPAGVCTCDFCAKFKLNGHAEVK